MIKFLWQLFYAPTVVFRRLVSKTHSFCIWLRLTFTAKYTHGSRFRLWDEVFSSGISFILACFIRDHLLLRGKSPSTKKSLESRALDWVGEHSGGMAKMKTFFGFWSLQAWSSLLAIAQLCELASFFESMLKLNGAYSSCSRNKHHFL